MTTPISRFNSPVDLADNGTRPDYAIGVHGVMEAHADCEVRPEWRAIDGSETEAALSEKALCVLRECLNRYLRLFSGTCNCHPIVISRHFLRELKVYRPEYKGRVLES